MGKVEASSLQNLNKLIMCTLLLPLLSPDVLVSQDLSSVEYSCIGKRGRQLQTQGDRVVIHTALPCAKQHQASRELTFTHCKLKTGHRKGG